MLFGTNERRGFALIELIIVVVILGLLAVSVVPRHVDMQKDAEFATAQRFGAVLKEGCSFYISKAAVNGVLTTHITFSTFVAYRPPGDPVHTVEIESALRNLLVDPAADLWSADDDYTTITLDFKSGARAVYEIDPATGEITDTYTGFDDGGGGCE
jgi:MSHA pilin protein MshA